MRTNYREIMHRLIIGIDGVVCAAIIESSSGTLLAHDGVEVDFDIVTRNAIWIFRNKQHISESLQNGERMEIGWISTKRYHHIFYPAPRMPQPVLSRQPDLVRLFCSPLETRPNTPQLRQVMKFNNPFKKGNKMTEQNQTPENAENAAKNQETVPPTYEELQQRTAELEAQLKEADLRLMANEQNLRRRHQEEIQAAHKFAAQKFATEMLAVKDYLEMAMKDESGNAEAMKMGVGMTLNELNRAFEAAQIKEIPAQQGDKLDPHRHQAMQEADAPGQEAGTIVSVLKKGYTLNDRVLRPSMVTVAKAEPAA